jgi:hypothetical protein
LHHLADGRVALTEGHVLVVGLFLVLDVQADDLLVMLLDELHRVEAGPPEMADIEIDYDV